MAIVSYGSYLTGLAFLTGTLVAVAAAAIVVVRSRLPDLRGAPRLLAIALLASAGLIWAHLLPGALGVLDRGTVALTALALLAAAGLVARGGAGRPAEGDGTGHRGWRLEEPIPAIAATLAALAVALVALAYLREAAVVPTQGIDALNFHLAGAAGWFESGSLWEIEQFVPAQAHGYYPNNGDVLLGSVMLPMDDAAFVRLVAAPLLGMLGIAIYGLAVELGATRAVAATFAALFVSIPATIEPALQGTLPDAYMLACLAAGVLFGLRYLREGRRAELLLCALGLGLAAGTKWYGVSSVGVLVVTATVALLAGGRPWRQTARELAMLIGVMAVAGGFWFLRNAVTAGNPVFPLEVSALGVTVFDAPRDIVRELSGFTVADYLTDSEVWDTYLLPALWRTLRAPALLAAAGLVLSAVLSLRVLRRRGGADPPTAPGAAAARRTVFLAGATLLLAALYTVTPYSALGPEGMPVQADANTRYLLPAILLATALGAAAFSASARLALAGQALALLAIATALPEGVRPGASALAEAGAALLAVAAAALLLAWAMRRAGRRGARAIAAAAAVVATCLAVIAGREVQQRIDSAPYVGADPALDGVLEAGEVRVALAGEWDNAPPAPPFPSFGPTLDNQVRYAGPFVEDMLRRYRRRAPFLRRIESERFDLLLVGRYLAPGGDPPEARWARRAGWRPLAESPRFLLLGRQ